MKKYLSLAFCIIIIGCTTNNKDVKIQYPKTNKGNVQDNYFGTVVADPYRWLEDDNATETAEWVKQQNEITENYLSKISYRNKIKNRLSELFKYERIGLPTKKGENIFFRKNDGKQNQSILYIKNSNNNSEKILIDPNKLSSDGTISLSGYSISHDYKYMAYTLSKGGSDWKTINILDINSGENLNDTLRWIKFSNIAWKKDGFYYSKYDEPKSGQELSEKNEFQKVYYHRIGTLQKEDILVYKNDEAPLHGYSPQTTDDEKYLFIHTTESTHGNEIIVKDLSKDNAEFIPLNQGFEYEYAIIDNIEDKLLVLTNKNAKKYKLVLMDINNPAEDNWKEIIPEQNNVLIDIKLCNNKIIAQYLKNACSLINIHSLEGKLLQNISLPGVGTVAGIKSNNNDETAYYSFTSFTSPTTTYSYNIESNTSKIFFEPQVKFDQSQFITNQIFYKSKDGTEVPAFITHKKDIKLDGNNPCILYGYGGFNISIKPKFKADKIVFLENGGIYVVANIRGGGEFGEEWYRSGTKLQKQNVFDDFIAAAEFLIENKYTSKEKLGINGGSNGGLLVGACMTQRPELFKLAIPEVGVLDMLRFHKFTIGWAWVNDYGSSDDSTEFNYLYNYSPLHNIKENIEYPATLITTADHDDRVVPAHSFKFAATLQEHQSGTNPALIRIDSKAGHGSGKPISKIIDEKTDFWSFVFYNLGITP